MSRRTAQTPPATLAYCRCAACRALRAMRRERPVHVGIAVSRRSCTITIHNCLSITLVTTCSCSTLKCDACIVVHLVLLQCYLPADDKVDIASLRGDENGVLRVLPHRVRLRGDWSDTGPSADRQSGTPSARACVCGVATCAQTTRPYLSID
jgi:hypothetical protein